MNKTEKEIRSRLKYLLEDKSRYEEETNIPESVGEMLDKQIIPNWIDDGILEDILEYIKENPNATIHDLENYEISILPPLEIVDDEDDE